MSRRASVPFELTGFLKDFVHVRVDELDYAMLRAGDPSLRQPYGDGPFLFQVTVTINSTCVRTKDPVDVTFSFGCPQKPDTEYVYGCVREAIAHETAECFQLGGLPFKDPHRDWPPSRYFHPDPLHSYLTFTKTINFRVNNHD